MSYQNEQYQQQGYGQPHQYGQQQPQQYYPPPGGPQGYSQVPASGSVHQHRLPEATDTGSYRNLNWTVKHRNTNSILNVELGHGDIIKSKPGAMVHMSPSVTLQGKIKVTLKKLFTGGEMAESSYTGPGLVALAPTLLGDIVALIIDQGSTWTVGKDAMLAHTSNVVKETKSQGLGKALFSGEDLFLYRFSGEGILWLTSYGAIETKHLGQGEQHIVDNGHLVAWNCNYAIEKAGGGSITSLKTGEGLVCRFTGPGTVYIQTRNQDEFSNWVRSQVGSNN